MNYNLLINRLIFDSIGREYHREYSGRSDDYEYLRKEIAENIVDRLNYVNRKFPFAVEIGTHKTHVYKAMEKNQNDIQRYIMTDYCRKYIFFLN